MYSVQAVFENSNGRKHRWTIKGIGEFKTPEALHSALVKLTVLNVFERNGVNLFQKVISASLIETIETIIFDNRNEDSSQENNEPEEEIALEDLKELSGYFGSDSESELSQDELQSLVSENAPAGFVFEGFVDDEAEESEEQGVEEIQAEPVPKKKTKKKYTKKEKHLMKQFNRRS